MDLRTFCLQAWSTIAGNTPARYSDFLLQLIAASQLSKTNLAIALHYLRLYKKNTVNQLDPNDNPQMANAVIVTALILSNKIFDDHCYTITTWINMTNQIPNHPQFTVKLLTSLEAHFLACVDYRVLLHSVALHLATAPTATNYITTCMVQAHLPMIPPANTNITTPPIYAQPQMATPITVVPTPLVPTFAPGITNGINNGMTNGFTPGYSTGLTTGLTPGYSDIYIPLTPETPAYSRPKRRQSSPVAYKRPRIDYRPQAAI